MEEPTTRLRKDIPHEILEMLLFEGEPQDRSRQELEVRFAEAASIPYMARWLGTTLDKPGHTEEPWEIWGTPGENALSIGPAAGGVAIAEIVTANGQGITTNDTVELGWANARRTISAVNFCAGVDTEVLEVCSYQSTKRDFKNLISELKGACESVLHFFAYAPGQGPDWYERVHAVVTKSNEKGM